MRYAIPLSALLLMGIGVCLHQTPANRASKQQEPLLQVRREAEVLPTLESGDSLAGSAAPANRSGSVERHLEKKAALSAGITIAGWRNLSSSLERGLRLSPLQQPGVDEVLRQRDEEIKSCHDGIRKSGLLDIRAFEWEVSRMKESWYRRIDALLNTVQHEEFVVLVENGLFNEGLAFTVDPGITVLE